MMNHILRSVTVGSVAAWVAWSPVQAGFLPGSSCWVAKGELNRPGGILALGDDHFLLQDVNVGDTTFCGMIVTVDSADRILAVDRRTGKVLRIDPRTGKEETLAKRSVWGVRDFLPDDAWAWGDCLFVAGFPRGETIRTLLMLEPESGPGSATTCRFLELGLEGLGPFTVTPAGHLLLVQPNARGVRIVRNARAQGAPGGELKQTGEEGKSQSVSRSLEKKAQTTVSPEADAMAEAAYKALVAQETAAAQAQARQVRDRAKKKAKRQRQQARAREEARTLAPEPAQFPVRPAPLAGPAAAPAQTLEPKVSPAEDPDDGGFSLVKAGGRRPGRDPVPPQVRRLNLQPCAETARLKVAGRAAAYLKGSHFPGHWEDWLKRQAPADAREEASLARLLDPGAPRSRELDPPRTLPAGLGRIALSPLALERAVRWMLANAALANQEYPDWLQAGAEAPPPRPASAPPVLAYAPAIQPAPAPRAPFRYNPDAKPFVPQADR